MFVLTHQPIDEAAREASLPNPRAGACVTFVGRVRNHHQGQAVLRLEYEAYAPLAQSEGVRILAEARARYDILDVHCEHRLGRLEIGEAAIWIGVAAAHRRDAFEACQYVIDEIKRRVPIWKKEYYVDGSVQWVACHCHPHPVETLELAGGES